MASQSCSSAFVSVQFSVLPSFVLTCLSSLEMLFSVLVFSRLLTASPASPSGKKFRSKPQLARYLGNQMDLSSFDFRTGKMLMSKLNKNRQRLRYDNNNQNKVRRHRLIRRFLSETADGGFHTTAVPNDTMFTKWCVLVAMCHLFEGLNSECEIYTIPTTKNVASMACIFLLQRNTSLVIHAERTHCTPP